MVEEQQTGEHGAIEWEERDGTYKYVKTFTDEHGMKHETATNASGNGLFRRTIYRSGAGAGEWKQIVGTANFHARSLADFRARVNFRPNNPATG